MPSPQELQTRYDSPRCQIPQQLPHNTRSHYWQSILKANRQQVFLTTE